MDCDPLDLRRYCEHCGAHIPDDADPRRIYCSVRCKNAVLNGLVSEARREARAGRSCRHCGGPVSDDLRADAVFCSAACQRGARNARRRVERTRAAESLD